MENQEAHQGLGVGSWQWHVHDLAHHASSVRLGFEFLLTDHCWWCEVVVVFFTPAVRVVVELEVSKRCIVLLLRICVAELSNRLFENLYVVPS